MNNKSSHSGLKVRRTRFARAITGLSNVFERTGMSSGHLMLLLIEGQKVEGIGPSPLEEGIRNEENLPRRPTKRALPSVSGIISIYSCSSYRGRETKELIPRDGRGACSNKNQSWTAEDPRLGLSKTFRRPRHSEYQWKMSEKWSKSWVTIQCSFKSKA